MNAPLTRRTFCQSAVLLSAAALAFPWRATAQEDEGSENWKYAGGRFWVACLGEMSDFDSTPPCFVWAYYRNRKDELMHKEPVYVRWERVPEGQQWSAVLAICTHLKCIVDFDTDKGRYVCPCHGSEFKLDGLVTRRPAKYNLSNLSGLLIIEDGYVYLRHNARRKEYIKPEPLPPPDQQPR